MPPRDEHRVLLGWEPRDSPTRTPLRAARGPRIDGTLLEWTGPGPARSWRLDGPIEARRAYRGEVWARLDGVPVISKVRLAARELVQVGVTGDEPGGAAALRRTLVAARGPCAWLDLSGIVVLRMDDPGACTSVYQEGWRFDGLDEAGFDAIGDVADRHDARVAIGFTPAWVDDGDPERGTLEVDGERTERVAGALHPSARIRYEAADGLVADGAAEYRGVQALSRRGTASIELHGYTHVHPDRELWAGADSRAAKQGWFREFAPENAPAGDAADDRVSRGLALFNEYFEGPPTTLICPGHAWTPEVLADASAAGLDMVCAGWLGVRNGAGYLPLHGVAVTALGWRRADLLATDAPVVAWFHDRDIAVEGSGWFDEALAAWRRGGATRFADLVELGAILGLRPRLARRDDRWVLEVRRAGGAPLPRPAPVALRFDEPPPATIAVETRGEVAELEVEPGDGGDARVTLPAGV